MRTLLMTSAALALATMGAASADAQRVVQRGPQMSRPAAPAMRGPVARPPMVRPGTGAGWNKGKGWTKPTPGHGWGNGPKPGHGWGNGPKPGTGHGWNGGGHKPPRWGGHHQGRWWGGWRAPGGWGAYRRPIRGFVLPSYWIAPSWYINDWGSYGLPQPQAGYNWSRYYDDAVLIDGRGSVHDSIGGVDWDGMDVAGAGYDDGHSYAEGDNHDGAYDDGGYRDESYADDGHAGAGAPYPQPSHHAGRQVPPPPVAMGPGRPRGPIVVQSGGQYSHGYYSPGGTVTTITVTSAPVVTTTTTEIIEDSVTYTRRPAKKVWKKKVWHAKPKPKCVC